MEFRKLKAKEIDCRISQIEKTWCTLLLYKDARVDQDILDETVGCMNWQKEYQLIDGQLFCTISIWDEDKKQWVGKQDVGVESFSEAEKGRASDAQKRSSFCFGIGRELYSAPDIFILPRKDIHYKNNGKDVEEFFEYKDGKYTTKTKFYVDLIGYDEDGDICDLIIRDKKGNIRFEQLTKEAEEKKNKEFLKLQDLVKKNEDKDDNFDREEFYKYFKVTGDNQLNNEQIKVAIDLLEKRLKK